MTRINIGIDPQRLPGKALLAEHREIKRVPNAVRKLKTLGSIPETFRLGKGHVRFFYNKLGYLRSRYRELHAECVRRGYNVTDFDDAWQGLPEGTPWQPTAADVQLIEQRLIERGHKL